MFLVCISSLLFLSESHWSDSSLSSAIPLVAASFFGDYTEMPYMVVSAVSWIEFTLFTGWCFAAV